MTGVNGGIPPETSQGGPTIRDQEPILKKYRDYLSPTGIAKTEQDSIGIAKELLEKNNRGLFITEWANAIHKAQNHGELVSVLNSGENVHRDPTLSERLRTELKNTKPDAKDDLQNPTDYDFNNTSPQQLLEDYDIVREAIGDRLKQDNALLTKDMSLALTTLIPNRYSSLTFDEVMPKLIPRDAKLYAPKELSPIQEVNEKPSQAVLERFKRFKDEGIGIPINIGDKTRGYLFSQIRKDETHRQIPALALVLDSGKIIIYRVDYPTVAGSPEEAYKKALELCNAERGMPINFPPRTNLEELENKFTSSIGDGGFQFVRIHNSTNGDSGRKATIKDYNDILKDEISKNSVRQAAESLGKSEAAFLEITDSILPPIPPLTITPPPSSASQGPANGGNIAPTV
ncbi:MAG: hypothetical protein Q7R51_02180 [bacterium]|nr:hypothetical protein [bacterium]